VKKLKDLEVERAGEIFYSLQEANMIIESWRRHYNAVRPHGGRLAIIPMLLVGSLLAISDAHSTMPKLSPPPVPPSPAKCQEWASRQARPPADSADLLRDHIHIRTSPP
jgi:hypothetical protein